jgi:peptidoglycan DL-endopeptidase CwlO
MLKQRAGTFALALGICLCAGQLVANAPALAVGTASTATTAAAQAAAPVAPRVSLSSTTRSLPWGSYVGFTSRAVDPRNGKPVYGGLALLQRWYGRGWKTVGVKRFYSTGAASFRIKPNVSTTYRVDLQGLNAAYRPNHSGSVRVTVRASGIKVLGEARKLTGKPYRYGAAGPRAFDCSGLTQYVYRRVPGVRLPHNANAQQRYGRAVGKAQARVGDLIVVRSGSYGYHVGIYAGGGYMYDAPRPGVRVGKHKIWTRNYVVRRFV